MLNILQKSLRRFREYSPESRRFFYSIVAIGFALDGVYGVLLNLYLLRLGYDALFIGQVNSVGLFIFALVSLPAGILGTWLGSRRILRFGAGIILLGMAFMPFGEFLPLAWREVSYIVNYALVLAGFSLYFVNGAPFLLASVREEQKNAVFATQNALMTLAAFAGSLFAGNIPVLLVNVLNSSLDKPDPYRYTLLLAALVALLAFIIAMSIKEVPMQVEQKAALALEPKVTGIGFAKAVIFLIGLMSAIRFLQVAGLGTVSVYFNVYMDTEMGLPPNVIGIVASIGRLIAVPAVLLAPRLMRRNSIATVAFWASLVTGLALLPIALVPNWTIASFAYVCALALSNLRFTAFLLYIMMLVPPRQQAVMAGAGEMAAGFSFALMALGGGYIVTEFSFRELFLLGFGLTALGSLMFWGYTRKAKVVVA